MHYQIALLQISLSTDLTGDSCTIKTNKVFSMITYNMFKKFEKTVDILLRLSARGGHNLVILLNGSCLTHCWQLNRNGYTIINAWKYLVLCNRSPHQSCGFDAGHSLENPWGFDILNRTADMKWIVAPYFGSCLGVINLFSLYRLLNLISFPCRTAVVLV